MTTRRPGRPPNLGVRVLSLDGGGSGALSELIILEKMMYRTKMEAPLDAMPRPCEYFEVIGGSGAGGIIALMLGRMRMSVKDAFSSYEQLRPQFKTGFGEEFKARKFEEALKDIFGVGRMEDSRPDACKTFVCAMNENNMDAAIPVLFRSYHSPEEPAIDCMIWEAARATSATPGLFKAMEIGSGWMKQRYVGGTVGNNNPTSLLLEEAKQMYPSRDVVIVCSIGGGHPDTIRIPKSPSSGDIAKTMKNLATDCERTHEQIVRRFRNLRKTYFRFNVQQGMQYLEPSQDWENQSKVLAHTQIYLQREEVKSQLTEAVKVIVNPVIPVNSPIYPKVCPSPTLRFRGRQEILHEMTEYFNTNVGRRHVFLLYGLGGSGKSQIAFKFVEQSSFFDVYFIDSTSKQTIENDLITLALVNNLKTAEEALLWLARQPTNWLILYNNADNINLNLFQYFPTCTHGNIIITSRNPDLRQLAESRHKVDRMELEETIDLLLDTAEYDKEVSENRQIAERLVQKLHCLPLAVTQAGAYIALSRALHTYLDQYESAAKRVQLLNQRPTQSEYAWSVYTSWKMSFEKLSPRAVTLLQLCSFIHHDDITEEIFKQAASYRPGPEGPTHDELHDPLQFLSEFLDNLTSEWDSMKFMALTDELCRYSLIELQATSRTITFSIHPLVHEWCGTTVQSDTPMEICMHRLLGMAMTSAHRNFRFKHQNFPHLDALLFKNMQNSGRQTNIRDLTFASRCIWEYYYEGKSRDGLALAESLLQVQELDELKTLDIQAVLAAMYAKQGRFSDAVQLEVLVLNHRIRLLGKNHRDTVEAMGNLAITYVRLGKHQVAQELQRTVLQQRQKTQGGEHPDTLRAMRNLALTYSQLGKYPQAEEWQRTVLERTQRILGEQHLYTLQAMGDLAVTYTRLGKYQLTEKLQQSVLQQRSQILGTENPDTLNAMGDLALTYSGLGKYHQAEELQHTVLSQRQRSLGTEHPDTLRAMRSLALTYLELGKYHQAEELQSTVLEKMRRILGEEHPAKMRSMENLARTYQHQGRWNEAEHLQVICLAQVCCRSYGNNQDILWGMAHLAKTYSRKGLLEQAEALQAATSKGMELMLGLDHPEVLETRMDLSATFREQGRLEEAERLGAEVFNRMLESDGLGKDHPITLRAQEALAITYRRHGRLKIAAALGRTALKKQSDLLGEGHPDTLRTTANLGLTYQDMGRLKEARKLQERALHAQEQLLGLDHPDTQENARNLDLTLKQLGIDHD
ncbi:hypothetical protein C8R44DRAFT_974174 [Mycena epipterygia]|nr:hypothetical protein C8R44DRAFT_974174 [Mycena epipterygia]